MKKDQLKDLMELTLEQSKKLLLRDGYVAPVGFICYGDRIDVVGLIFKNQKDKEIQIRALGKMARTKKADAVFIVIESWYVTSVKKDFSIIPSEHPMRKECIVVVGEYEQGDVNIIQKFERNKRENGEKDEFIFGEKEETDTGFSRFSFGIKKHKTR